METEPIPYRTQNGGDYDEYQTVRSEFAADSVGQFVHQSVPLFISNIETTGPADFSPIHFARDSRSINHAGQIGCKPVVRFLDAATLSLTT